MKTTVISDLFIHLIITGLVTIFLWKRYKNWHLLVISFLTGFLIDLDHLFDYFYYLVSSSAYQVGIRFSFKEFFNPVTYVEPTGKTFVLLHGWEYLIIFWLIAQKLKKKIPGIHYALLLPYFFHLLIDQLPSGRSLLAYFFFHRLVNNFSLNAFNGR